MPFPQSIKSLLVDIDIVAIFAVLHLMTWPFPKIEIPKFQHAKTHPYNTHINVYSFQTTSYDVSPFCQSPSTIAPWLPFAHLPTPDIEVLNRLSIARWTSPHVRTTNYGKKLHFAISQSSKTFPKLWELSKNTHNWENLGKPTTYFWGLPSVYQIFQQHWGHGWANSPWWRWRWFPPREPPRCRWDVQGKHGPPGDDKRGKYGWM